MKNVPPIDKATKREWFIRFVLCPLGLIWLIAAPVAACLLWKHGYQEEAIYLAVFWAIPPFLVGMIGPEPHPFR